MSETPRTKAAAVPIYAIRAPQLPDGTYDKRGKWVPEGVCEQLERELNEAKIQRCEASVAKEFAELACERAERKRDQWRECARELALCIKLDESRLVKTSEEKDAIQRFDELEKGAE